MLNVVLAKKYLHIINCMTFFAPRQIYLYRRKVFKYHKIMNYLDKLAREYARKEASLRVWIDKNYPNNLNREEMGFLIHNIITMIKQWTE